MAAAGHLSIFLFHFQHIDQIMSSHGKQIMQAVTLILESEHSIEVKEQVSFFFSRPLSSVYSYPLALSR